MVSNPRSWTFVAALALALCASAQSKPLKHYTALVEGIDSNLKVKLLIEALLEVDPNGKYIPEDALYTRTIRIESYEDLDLAKVNTYIAPSHFAVKALAHGQAPIEVLQGAAHIAGEPYLIETGDESGDRFRYEDAKRAWEAKKLPATTTNTQH